MLSKKMQVTLGSGLLGLSLLVLLWSILAAAPQMAVVGVANAVAAMLLIRRAGLAPQLSQTGKIAAPIFLLVLIVLIAVDQVVGSDRLRLIMFSTFIAAAFLSILTTVWRSS